MSVPENIPQEVQQLADNLGVSVESLLAAQAQQPTQEAPPVATPPEQPAAAPAAPEATVVPTETAEQKLERELAESRQETDQVRRLAQTATEGRVVGSGGEGVAATPPPAPDIATIEPGLRYAYQNGLISDEQLQNRVGPLLASLLSKHAGGEVV